MPRSASDDSVFQAVASPTRSALRWTMTDLTRDRKVDRMTFDRLWRHFSEREIREIVWLVASEHLYNLTNIGLNIHSDMLCDVSKKERSGTERAVVGSTASAAPLRSIDDTRLQTRRAGVAPQPE